MIRKPATERTSVDGHVLIEHGWKDWMKVWDGRCTYCAVPISLDEPYWDWHFGSHESLFMHLECFAAWAPRITKAARELEGFDWARKKRAFDDMKAGPRQPDHPDYRRRQPDPEDTDE